MNTIVISQPMLFPWVGLFEQIRLADAYVHYDDVQYSKGSFTNRVQIKTSHGLRWLSVPLHHLRLGQKILEVKLDNERDWRREHVELLAQTYAPAPFQKEMLALVEAVYQPPATTICEVASASIEAVCSYFEFPKPGQIVKSSQLDIAGQSSQRVLDIVKHLGGSTYVTGHGARNYLDHSLFEASGVRVEYLDYQKIPYPQLHGAFTPTVSILDLIANLGKNGRAIIASKTMYWKDFIK